MVLIELFENAHVIFDLFLRVSRSWNEPGGE